MWLDASEDKVAVVYEHPDFIILDLDSEFDAITVQGSQDFHFT